MRKNEFNNINNPLYTYILKKTQARLRVLIGLRYGSSKTNLFPYTDPNTDHMACTSPERETLIYTTVAMNAQLDGFTYDRPLLKIIHFNTTVMKEISNYFRFYLSCSRIHGWLTTQWQKCETRGEWTDQYLKGLVSCTSETPNITMDSVHEAKLTNNFLLKYWIIIYHY